MIYTDSKGYSVGRHVDRNNQLEDSIVWRCQEGLKFKTGFDWLKEDINDLKDRYGTIHIYFWLGTCDLTSKYGRYIHLNSNYVNDRRRLIRQINLLANFCYRESVELTILEIPLYSIRRYNEKAGHNFPDLCADQDEHLAQQLEIINQEIREINDINYKVSPRFTLDIERNRSNNWSQRRYYHNFNLYRDGIHPSKPLAKLWLRKLSLMVKKDCF